MAFRFFIRPLGKRFIFMERFAECELGFPPMRQLKGAVRSSGMRPGRVEELKR